MHLSKKVQSVPEMIAATEIKEPVVAVSTPKQEALADKLVEEMAKPKQQRLSKSDLLRAVGYTDKSVKVRAHEMYSAKGFQEAMMRRGLMPDALVEVAQDAMKAKKGTFYQGEYVESDRVDHDTALKGAHFVADILGIKKTISPQIGRAHV